MSNREIAIDLINNLPEYKLTYIIAFLKGVAFDNFINDNIYSISSADDLAAIKAARAEYQNGETISHEDINWD